jgi:hypothetical protein
LETVYDWVTVGIFVALVVLFLQRSMQEEPEDRLYQYFPPAIGCAVVNYLGNEGYAVAAVAILGAIIGYILFILKPFGNAESDKD